MQDIAPEEPEQRVVAPASIRDLRPSRERMRLQTRLPDAGRDDQVPPVRVARRRWLVWGVAASMLFLLLGILFFVFYERTIVTVMPRTHVVTFDASNPLTAYPENAAAGIIAYAVLSQEFEDSAVVEASGMEHVEEKANGTITISNATNRQLRLIKNTRFETNGLVYRIPASVEVPAAKGAIPGTASASVFADETGPKYNIAAGAAFTLPGLKATADYTKVTAKAASAFIGGFSGDRPAVSPAALTAAQAEIRTRLQERVREFAESAAEDQLVLPGLSSISFETLPATDEPGSGVRVHEKIKVIIPVFPMERFASSVAEAVSANAEGQRVLVRFSKDTTAQLVQVPAPNDFGVQPITFSLSGKAQLVWHVDTEALTAALAGKPESLFQTIVQGIPAIEEATARIIPFSRKSFPNASRIEVEVEDAPQF